ncbi:MAG TPA: lipid IV(A) 3-deoxy-D-manno-octulosonic acid transferase [Steroidobacteraceae bacterium]|jgi:3-deoxy-D-manno-octulosonic-acid transferase|nr:lipid IV(A) 3-deoxy-D-manno-octulosonic acid transferase [Steroidobacteraceae bacterium]
MIRAIYSLLVTVAAPAAFAIVLLRGFRDRAYWEHPGERFGWGPRTPAPALWLHAVSLGEVAAATELVRALRTRHPDVPFVLTTSTPTGRARARALFGADVDVRFLPYDTPGAVGRFLDRIRPRVAIILETELWPNLVRGCVRRGIPVVFASARLTARSVARYRRLGRLFGDTVAAGELIAAQSPQDAERFIAVGADPGRTRVVGNVKFDLRLDDSVRERGRELRRSYLGSRPVWVAGSTHAGEEEQVLVAHAELRVAMPDLLLVLVPRHPQRFHAVAALLTRRGVRFERRSGDRPVRPEAEVLLVDSVGELTALYAAADAAFVGGSLVPVGGHNLLEPAVLGVPVITGPHTGHAADIARPLIARGGAVEVGDSGALAEALRRLLQDPAARVQAVHAAREFVDAHRGAVGRLTDLIDRLIARSNRAASP